MKGLKEKIKMKTRQSISRGKSIPRSHDAGTNDLTGLFVARCDYALQAFKSVLLLADATEERVVKARD